jgi:CHAT domain-containing protein/tetratricopeptide (TPR) repeat protein
MDTLWLLMLACFLAGADPAGEPLQSVDPAELFQEGQQRLEAGDSQAALELLRRVAALLPEEDVVLSALAQALVNLGQLDEAREVYRRAARLAARHGARERLAIHHQSLVVLASLYPPELQRAREAASALPDTPGAQRALAEFGPLAQQVANLMAMGKLAEARPVIEQALAVAQKGFGPDHPSSLWAQNSLGDVLRVRGDARRALPLYEAVVKGCAGRMGADFPDCLTYRNNLATCLRELGRVPQALELMEAVWRASQQALGPEHLLTVLYQGELGLQLSAAGQSMPGLDLLRQAIASCAGSLEESNPYCLAMQGKLVSAAEQLGLFVLAREQADRLLRAGRASLPPGHPLAEEIERLRASLRVKSASLDGRVEEYEAALKTARARRGRALLNHAWLLAGAYQSQGRLREALPLRREALAEAGRLLGPDHPTTVGLEAEVAVLLLELGEPFEAVSLFEHVRACLLRQKGEADAETLQARSGLGHALFQAGQLDRARSVLEAALLRARERLGAEHEVSLSLANNLGLTMSGLGQGERARGLYAENWEILHRAGRAEDEDGLRARHNLAQTLRELGLLGDAEDHARAALEGRARLLGRSHPHSLYSLHGLGLVLLERGHLPEARLLLEEALRLRRETLGERHPETIQSLSTLSSALADLGERAEALRFAELAARLSDEVLGEDHPRSLERRLQVARVLQAQDPRRGLLAFQRVLPEAARILGAEHPTSRLLEVQVLALRREQGERELEAALASALERLRAGSPAGSFWRGYAGYLLGRLAVDGGRFAEARALLDASVQELRALLGESDAHVLEAENVRAWALWGLGERARSLELLAQTMRRALARFETQVWTADAGTRGRMLSDAQRALEDTLGLLRLSGSPEAGRLTLELAFAFKGLGLRVAGEVSALRRAQADPALAGQARELSELRRELGERLTVGPRGEPVEDFEARLEALRARVREREIRLARSVVGLRRTAERPSFEAVAARLGKDEALVEYLAFRPEGAGPERLLAAVLAPGATPETGLVDLGPLAEISERVQVLRGLLGLPDLSAPEAHLAGHTRRLHALLWQPLEPWLRGRARVWVVPEGPLHLLPFAALQDPAGHFLVERVELGLLGASRDLLPRPVEARGASGPALVLAGPDYGQAAGGAAAPGTGELAGLRFSALPAAGDEGAVVAELLRKNGREVRLLGGAEASEGALRRARRPALLHLATHGFFLDAQARPAPRGELVASLRGLSLAPGPAAGAPRISGGPRPDPLARSGLALAEANRGLQGERQADGHDGLLLALEALDLELDGCRLVVLSACETGLGDVHRGEGVQGLRRAFMEAGASAVLSTLWQVSDEGTRVFMERFYGRLLAGEPAPRALTQTQRELMREARYAHPFFWAPFLVTGTGAGLAADSGAP